MSPLKLGKPNGQNRPHALPEPRGAGGGEAGAASIFLAGTRRLSLPRSRGCARKLERVWRPGCGDLRDIGARQDWASGGRRARRLPSPGGGRSGRGRGRGGGGLPAGLAGAPGALPRRGEWAGRDGRRGRGLGRGSARGPERLASPRESPAPEESPGGRPRRGASPAAAKDAGAGRRTRPRQQLSPPRPPRRAGWRSERRGRVSGREGAGAPRELAPTSLPRENPAEAERSLSAPAQPIGRRARVAATAAGARSAGGAPLVHGRPAAVPRPRELAVAPEAGSVCTVSLPSWVSPPSSGAQVAGPLRGLASFTSGGSRLWN